MRRHMDHVRVRQVAELGACEQDQVTSSKRSSEWAEVGFPQQPLVTQNAEVVAPREVPGSPDRVLVCSGETSDMLRRLERQKKDLICRS